MDQVYDVPDDVLCVVAQRRNSQDARLAEAVLLERHEAFVRQQVVRLGVDPRDYDFEDALQAGRIGLLRAIRNFDPAFGVKLLTYARHYIRGEVIRDLFGEQDDPAVVCIDEVAAVAVEDTALAAIDDSVAILLFLSTLRARDRELIVRTFWVGERPAEVARRMGISRSAASQRLTRVMAEGRDALTSIV